MAWQLVLGNDFPAVERVRWALNPLDYNRASWQPEREMICL